MMKGSLSQAKFAAILVLLLTNLFASASPATHEISTDGVSLDSAPEGMRQEGVVFAKITPETVERFEGNVEVFVDVSGQDLYEQYKEVLTASDG